MMINTIKTRKVGRIRGIKGTTEITIETDNDNKPFLALEAKMTAQNKNGAHVPEAVPDNATLTTQNSSRTVIAGKLSLLKLTEQALLLQIAPIGALVNGQGDILYLHGRTGMYLEPTAGETGVNNILQMARKGFRRELTMALSRAVKTKEIIHCLGLKVKTNGDFTTFNLTIRPLCPRPEPAENVSPARTPEQPLYLVVIEEAAHLDSEWTLRNETINIGGKTDSTQCASFPTAPSKMWSKVR